MSSKDCTTCDNGAELWGSEVEQCKDCGRTIDEVFPKNGKACSVCHAPQHRLPPGDSCRNGHGGAPGVALYPECEKLRAARPTSDKLSEFLDWLSEQKIVLCTLNPEHYKAKGGEYYQITERPEELLARFFNIDLKKVEKERRQMLDELHKTNERER